jgi:CubicO group peptidase (beta-lactamase class C family)
MKIKKSFLIMFVLLAFQAAFAQTEKEIADRLRERVEIGRTNQSIVVGLIDEKGVRFTSYGKTSATAGARNADENTVFEIGSVTKALTGILLAEAIRRGEVALDDPISKYLPKNVKTPTRGDREITLLDLATHTSALPRLPGNFAPKDGRNPYADYTVEQMYEFLSRFDPQREIGERYEYSNFGAGLLGHILSLRAKMSYEDLVKTRILKPLGMKDTVVTLSPDLRERTAPGFDENGEPASFWDLPALAGAGALRSTAADLAKLISANLNPNKIDLREAFAAARKPHRDTASTGMKIGLGWHILSAPGGELVWHNGGTGGYRSFIGFDPAKRRGVVVLTNTSESVDDLGFHLLDAQLPLKKIKPFVAVGAETLDRYTGVYELAPNVLLTVTREGDKLFAQLTGQPRFRVFAETENKFYFKVVNAQLTFNAGADGKIESLTLHQGGERIARKIK